MRAGTILLVEDNPDDVELTLRAFRQHAVSNDVVVARDGAEAIDILLGAGDREPLTPVLVLLDFKLPKLSGLEVLQALRKEPRTALVPVVVLTSSVQDDDVAAAYEGGANSYIRKPVDFTEFGKVVHQLGMYWLLINQSPPESHG
jgi:two-component system, response regulator